MSVSDDAVFGGDGPTVDGSGLPVVSHDLLVAATAERLVGEAQAAGIALTGEGGLLTGLVQQVLQTALEAEMTGHLGYSPHSVDGRGSGNSRNGYYPKTVRTEVGDVELRVPRDRNGSFQPATVPVGQRRLSGLDEMVISLYAKGLTTGDICAHLSDVYGQDIDRSTISRIAHVLLEDMQAWQSRPLDPLYPVLFVDGIRIKIRDGTVSNRVVYVVSVSTWKANETSLVYGLAQLAGKQQSFGLGL